MQVRWPSCRQVLFFLVISSSSLLFLALRSLFVRSSFAPRSLLVRSSFAPRSLLVRSSFAPRSQTPFGNAYTRNSVSRAVPTCETEFPGRAFPNRVWERGANEERTRSEERCVDSRVNRFCLCATLPLHAITMGP